VQRPRTAILLILALLTALLTPVRTSWSCPDGTACVAERGRGYVCAGNHCAARSCCAVAKPCVCKHGAFPGLGGPWSTKPGVDTPDHCRFHVSAPPSLTAVLADSGGWHGASVDLALAPIGIELSIPSAPVFLRVEETLGYRPPPLLRTGPSRAPPSA
jgi:hypothetical protein